MTTIRNLSFSSALSALKSGHRICRTGWNGKNMWIALGAGNAKLPADKFWNPHSKAHAESNGGSATVDSYFIMKTAQGTIQMGWVPSQADMLANDWESLDKEETNKNSNEPSVLFVELDPNKDIGQQLYEAINKSTNSIGPINNQENVKQSSYFTVSWYSYRQNEDCVEGNTVGIFSTVQKAKEAMKQGFLCTIESLEDSDLTVVNTENSVEITTNNCVCKYYIQELKID